MAYSADWLLQNLRGLTDYNGDYAKGVGQGQTLALNGLKNRAYQGAYDNINDPDAIKRAALFQPQLAQLNPRNALQQADSPFELIAQTAKANALQQGYSELEANTIGVNAALSGLRGNTQYGENNQGVIKTTAPNLIPFTPQAQNAPIVTQNKIAAPMEPVKAPINTNYNQQNPFKAPINTDQSNGLSVSDVNAPTYEGGNPVIDFNEQPAMAEVSLAEAYSPSAPQIVPGVTPSFRNASNSQQGKDYATEIGLIQVDANTAAEQLPKINNLITDINSGAFNASVYNQPYQKAAGVLAPLFGIDAEQAQQFGNQAEFDRYAREQVASQISKFGPGITNAEREYLQGIMASGNEVNNYVAKSKLFLDYQKAQKDIAKADILSKSGDINANPNQVRQAIRDVDLSYKAKPEDYIKFGLAVNDPVQLKRAVNSNIPVEKEGGGYALVKKDDTHDGKPYFVDIQYGN